MPAVRAVIDVGLSIICFVSGSDINVSKKRTAREETLPTFVALGFAAGGTVGFSRVTCIVIVYDRRYKCYGWFWERDNTGEALRNVLRRPFCFLDTASTMMVFH